MSAGKYQTREPTQQELDEWLAPSAEVAQANALHDARYGWNPAVPMAYGGFAWKAGFEPALTNHRQRSDAVWAWHRLRELKGGDAR
jgi:hypothetical protein